MKKGWKKLLALGLTGAMLGSLAGCGDGKESQSADASSSAPEKSQSSEKESGDTGDLKDSGENVTIKFTWWGNQGRHAYTQELLDEYTELHPNVTFEAIPAGWDGYFDKLSTQAASGSMPDIVQMDYLYLTTYAKNHSVTDLQPFIDNGTIDVSQMAENDVNTGKIDGALAGLVGATGTLSIGYNPEVFQEAGLEEPTNREAGPGRSLWKLQKPFRTKLGNTVSPREL